MSRLQPNLHIENLRVSYGRKNPLAVDVASLDLEFGSIYGLIGRNGAGKTTLLQALSNQLSYNGTVTIREGAQGSSDEYPVWENPRALDQMIYSGPDALWPDDIPVGNLFKIGQQRWATWDRSFANQLIEDFVVDVKKTLASMSRGQKSAVSIVMGLAAQCPITFLDEPYLGLDVQNRELFYRRLSEDLDRNPRTIVLSTHHIGDAERVLDEVIFIDEGRITGVGPLEDVVERVHVLTGSSQAVEDVLRGWESTLGHPVSSAIIQDATTPGIRRLTLDVAPGSDDETALTQLVAGSEATLGSVDLEHAVLALTGRTAADV